MKKTNNKMTCAPSEDADQPGHPSCLIRVFAWRSMGIQGPTASSCGQRRLIRPGAGPSWSVFAGRTGHFVGFWHAQAQIQLNFQFTVALTCMLFSNGKTKHPFW